MTRLFMNSEYYQNLEREMQMPTGHTPKGGGSFIPHTSCDDEKCVCFDRELPAGAISKIDLLKIMIKDVKCKMFSERINEIINSGHYKLFRNDLHEEQWEYLIYSGNLKIRKCKPAFISALFLLSADEFLWERSKDHIGKNQIDFGSIRIAGVGEDGYTIYQAAKSVYKDCMKIKISELSDAEIVSGEVLCLLLNAFLLRRYGAGVLLVNDRYELFVED